MKPDRIQRAAPALLLCLPLFLIGIYFACNPFDFHSDDFEYWRSAVYWQEKLRRLGLFAWLSELHHWNFGRATFHPIVALPFLALFGSMEGSLRAMAFLFTFLISFGAFRILRKNSVPDLWAAMGAATISTFPYLLGVSRAFLPELSFCAFALLAAAALPGAWAEFLVFYFLALLSRPGEGALLLPVFLIFFPSRRTGLLSLGALGLAGLAFLHRQELFTIWVKAALYPDAAAQIAAPLSSFAKLEFVAKAFYLSLGFSGILLAVAALAQRGRRAWGMLGMLALAFVLLSLVDHPATRETFGRYTLALVLFFLLANVIDAGRLRWLMLPLLLANVLVCVLAGIGPGTRDLLRISPAMQHGYDAFHFYYYPPGAELVVDALRATLPKKSSSRVLLAGRDPFFLPAPARVSLRMLKDWPDLQLSAQFPASHYEPAFLRQAAEEPVVKLTQFQIDAVLFATGGEGHAFPNEEFLRRIKKPESLGLQKVGAFRWTDGREIEIYLPL